MKKLEEISFDYARCREQVAELQNLLQSKTELHESKDVLPFFRARQQMAVLLGMFNPRIGWWDRIAWEFNIFGDFACDLVVGDWTRGAYCFVEFEDAQPNSIFEKAGQKATREWGRRFDHGYSQIIDWFHKLNDRSFSNDNLSRFGQYEITYEAILVIGRDSHMDVGEKQRLKWRSDNVVINSKKVYCMTYDELFDSFSKRLGMLSLEKSVIDTPKPGESPPEK
jgi:hypothetical protein